MHKCQVDLVYSMSVLTCICERGGVLVDSYQLPWQQSHGEEYGWRCDQWQLPWQINWGSSCCHVKMRFTVPVYSRKGKAREGICTALSLIIYSTLWASCSESNTVVRWNINEALDRIIERAIVRVLKGNYPSQETPLWGIKRMCHVLSQTEYRYERI